MSSDDDSDAFENFRKEQQKNVNKRYMTRRELANLDTMDDFIAHSSSDSDDQSDEESEPSKLSDEEDSIIIETAKQGDVGESILSNVNNQSSVSLFSDFSVSACEDDVESDESDSKPRKRLVRDDDDSNELVDGVKKRIINKFAYKLSKTEITTQLNARNKDKNISNTFIDGNILKVANKIQPKKNYGLVTPISKISIITSKTVPSKLVKRNHLIRDNDSDDSNKDNYCVESGDLFSESDEYSKAPCIDFRTPLCNRKKKLSKIIMTVPIKRNTQKRDFITSLLNHVEDEAKDYEALIFSNRFKFNKEKLASKIYQIFNEKVFSNKLPFEIDMRWYPRLSKTAGRCVMSYDKENPSVHLMKIELSTKVLTDSERLLKTLVHEMCHGAAWVINKRNDHHGPIWKAWTWKVQQVFSELSVSNRCHSYEIAYKYEYTCTNCHSIIMRHTKSLNTENEVCEKCSGKFALFLNKANGEKKLVQNSDQRVLTGFSKFVKDNYKKYRSTGIGHREVMGMLAEKYKSEKNYSDIAVRLSALCLAGDP